MKIFKFKKTRVIQSNRIIALFNLITGKHIRGWAGLRYAILIKEGLNYGDEQRLLKHELQHIKDMREVGYFRFVRTYFYYNKTVGYSRNPFELRARQAEGGAPPKSVANDNRIKLR
jgi:hypothetical protein